MSTILFFIIVENQLLDLQYLADYAMDEETVIVGDASGCFLFKYGDNSTSYSRELYSFDAVGLVFARDKDKSHGNLHVN